MKKLDKFWAESLGCRKKDLKFKQSKIVSKKDETDYNKDRSENEIDIFIRDNTKIVSCSKKTLPKLEKQILEIEISKKNLEDIGLTVKNLLGPAFLSYNTKEHFKKVDTENCRKLNKNDKKLLEELKQEADSEEISNSIEDYAIEQYNIFGKFMDEELVAVSSYETWNNTVGFPGVFVKKDYRGNGYGKEIVSGSTENILEKDLIPAYRTLQRWKSSVQLAKSLGYQEYATTYLVKLANNK